MTLPHAIGFPRMMKEPGEKRVFLPEFIPSRWWQHLLHNQTALLIKATLLFSKGKIVTSVPYRLED